MNIKISNFFFELSVCVRVLEKRSRDDYQGRIKDGLKITGYCLSPRHLEANKKHLVWRMEELIKEYAEKYGLLPDSPKEEDKLWNSGEWPPKESEGSQ